MRTPSLNPRDALPLWKDRTSDEMHAHLAPAGVSPRLARRLLAWTTRHRHRALPLELPEVRSATLREVASRSSIPHLALLSRIVSPHDGFVKYLFRGEGPETFEAVRIPLLHRPSDPKYIVCVSSQAGCAMGCTFCATGRMGFRRNLATWEIVDQVVKIQDDSEHLVRGVVFMGMGEPLRNYARVIRAARILSAPCGMAIAAKAITISTVGIPDAIRRYTREGHRFRLIVSLTSADEAMRARLFPLEARYPLPEILDAVREHHRATGLRATFAWTMISGVNTRPEDARALARACAGLPVLIDLVDVNDPTGAFAPPGPEELDRFRDALRAELGMPVVRRYSGGRDIHAACGMLATPAPEIGAIA